MSCENCQCKDQPTVEQSLHSIALSLIELTRHNAKTYRQDRKALQFNIRTVERKLREKAKEKRELRRKKPWWRVW